jgi:hypothetical protein
MKDNVFTNSNVQNIYCKYNTIYNLTIIQKLYVNQIIPNINILNLL